MARSILSASRVNPVWQIGAYRLEGPDEDTFTLGLSALNRLGNQVQAQGPRALQRLHIVGAFAPEADWAFGEALGIPRLEIRRHPSIGPGLWGALAAAAHDEGPIGREAVVAAVEAHWETRAGGVTVVRHGAGAAAYLLGTEPGLAVLRHGFRGHAPGRTPTGKTIVASWLDALGIPRGGDTAEVVLSFEEEAARWQSAWEETAPGATVTYLEAPAGEGSPALRAAELLWELARRLRKGRRGFIAESGRGRTGFAGFRLDGPVHWSGEWGRSEPGLELPSERFLERAQKLDPVSQGAYVPHPRYLENLPSRWRLVGDRCSLCHALSFPASGRCRSCGRSDELREEVLPRNDLVVEAVTTISPGAQPTEFDALVDAGGGYDVAIVALESGARATVQVTDAVPGRLRIGDRVDLVLRRLYPMEGEWRYGLKAVPQRVDGPSPGSAPKSRRLGPPRAATTSSRSPTVRRASPRGRGGRAAERRRRGR
jgi:uncharacterized protein